MRLEVLVVSNGDVQVYPLNRPKIVIGSGDSCDIVLSAEGVSRKHVFVLSENDQYFVADQGSTNGTFINEERLQPGKRVEFTSFFPVRLGENVLLTLLSDEDSDGMDFSSFNDSLKELSSPSIKVTEKTDATRAVSLAELNATKTQSLIKKRKEIETKAKVSGPPKKRVKEVNNDKSRMLLAKVGAFLLIGSAAYYNFFIKEDDVGDASVAKVGEVVTEDPLANAPKTVEINYLIPESELIPHETIVPLLKDLRCVSEIEKYLCDNVMGTKENPWGVAQVKLTLNIMLDGSVFIEDARKHVDPPRDANPEAFAQYEKNVKETAMASFLVYGVPALDYEKLKDYTLTFALMNPAGDKVEVAAAMTPEALKKLKEILNEKILTSVSTQGIGALQFTHKYYRLY